MLRITTCTCDPSLWEVEAERLLYVEAHLGYVTRHYIENEQTRAKVWWEKQEDKWKKTRHKLEAVEAKWVDFHHIHDPQVALTLLF